MNWSIILHGGAGRAIKDPRASRSGVLAALSAGQAILERGGRALDAAEAAVRALEDDPSFNAGYGSVLTRDGTVEMDAAVMDGASLGIGAVAAIAGVRHPVSVARALLPEPPILLVGDGARRFAAERGLELCAPEAMVAPQIRGRAGRDAAGCDTVGCIARDSTGDIAVATSTGGLSGVLPGRVGDTPLPGCGYYADNRLGAVAFSGEGEVIARALLAARVMANLETDPPDRAVARALPLIGRFAARAGAIAMGAEGRIGWGHTTEDFAVAHARAGGPARAFIRRDEDRDAS